MPEERNIKESLQIFSFLGDFEGCTHAVVKRKSPPKSCCGLSISLVELSLGMGPLLQPLGTPGHFSFQHDPSHLYPAFKTLKC